MSDQRSAYRVGLVEGRRDAQQSFDKALMSLAGGALGIALGFVRTAEAPIRLEYLVVSWVAFTSALLAMLYSFKTSRDAFTEALRQEGAWDEDRIYREPPGGENARITEQLNRAAFLFLVLGITALGTFVAMNLGRNLR